MHIEDTAIPEIEDKILDKEIPDLPRLSNKPIAIDNLQALKAAYIENYNTGVPVAESYQQHRGELNIESSLQQLTNDKVALDNTALSEEFEEQLSDDPRVFTETAPLVVEMQEENIAKSSDTDRQFIDAVASPTASPEVKAAATNQVKLYQILQSSLSKYSKGDMVADFFWGIVPFVSTGRELGLLGSVFGNEEAMQELVLEFKSKTFEEQQEMFPALSLELLEGLGPVAGGDALTKFITPGGDEELGAFSNWWKLIDAADIATLGTTVVLKATAVVKGFNIPKLIKSVENTEGSADAVVAALVSDEAAEAMHIKKDTAFGDAVAFDTSAEDLGHTRGVSSDVQKNISKFFDEADQTVEDIMTGNGYLKEGILNTVERAAKELEAMNKLSAAKHEDITITGRTENTTRFSYRVAEEGDLSEEVYILDMTLNDVGQWDQDQLSVLSEFLASPSVFAKGLARLDVNTAQRLDSQTAKVFKSLSNLQREAVKPLGNLSLPKNKRRFEAVEKALREGDEFKNPNGSRGKLFDGDELKGIYNLDDAQIETYFQTNRLYNNLWRLRNSTKREEMIAFGFKRVKLLDAESSFGKNFETPQAAKSALVTNKVTNIFDVAEDAVHNNITEAFLEEQYAAGKTLVKLPEPYLVGGDRGKFSHVLAEADGVTELPAVVLNRKVAYVPRVSKDGYWFVKEFGDSMLDGEMRAGQLVKTLRYFDNKADAESYLQTLIRKDVDDKGLTEAQATTKYKALEDREQEIISTATGNFSHGSGGMYTGARADDGILFGLDGTKGQRLNAYEALSHNIANIAKLVPVNQWRLGLEQRWINSANALLDVPIKNFGELPDNIKSTRKGEFLNKMAAQVRDWQGFPSREEQLYNSVNQRMYEWSLKNNFSAGAKITGWMRGKDPISSARAAAFHSLLGWFNPAQLWVQAQGMSVAVSMNLGKNLTKTLRHTAALTWLGQNPMKNARYKQAARLGGMEEKELVEMQALWKKTGFEDSILQTADHAASMKGHGIAMDALSDVADTGLFFYRHGELLNRRMAFTTALDEYRTVNKISDISDEALKGIMDRANNLMLNITKANRAQWQKGVLSLPTQFFQVSAKALETMVGFNDNLTGMERFRVFAGQIALYGTAGVPLVNLGANYLKEYLGVTQEDIDNNPVLVKSWNEGFWGFTTLGIFGVDAHLSSRGSLVKGVTDFMDNWMFAESTAATKLLGAFGSTGQRFWDSLSQQMRPLVIGAYPIDIIDVAKIPLLPFLDSISTWRNTEKAVFMQSIDKILDKHGNVNVERDFTIRESLMASIGFQLSDETQRYTLEERTQHVLDANERVADLIIMKLNEVAIREATVGIDEKYMLGIEQFYAVVYGSVEFDRQRAIRKSVESRLKRDDKQTRAIKRYIDKIRDNTTSGLSLMMDGLTGTRVINLLPEQEEE